MPCNVNTTFDRTDVYDGTDRALLMAHVRKHFGDLTGIGQANLSTGRSVDILHVTPPSRKTIGKFFASENSPAHGDETLLLTSGAGALPMNVPQDSDLPPRAEYLMRLPVDWNVQSFDETYAWPVHLLLAIASHPEAEHSYNAWGHTFSFAQGRPFAENTLLCAALLTGMNDREGQCRLHNGEQVTFYEVIPLYAEELQFTTEYGAIALIEEFMRYRIPRVVTPQRPNAARLVMYRKKLATEKEKDIRLRLQNAPASIEERLVLKELLRTQTGVGKRTLDRLKTITSSFFTR